MRQDELAAQRFGAAAQRYLHSGVHAAGADLKRLEALARRLNRPAALDIGCGAGHSTYALARGGAAVTACDISDTMLALAAAEAGRRGLKIATRKCPAGRLDFPNESFDLVATRYSAHHWPDVAAALGEARRVVRPGGTLVIVDIAAPEDPLCDTVLQTVEFLRDGSHVRDYRISEWTAALKRAGFAAPEAECWTVRMNFADWTERMHTPPVRAAAARDVFLSAPEEARRRFGVTPAGKDFSFAFPAAWILTRPLPA